MMQALIRAQLPRKIVIVAKKGSQRTLFILILVFKLNEDWQKTEIICSHGSMLQREFQGNVNAESTISTTTKALQRSFFGCKKAMFYSFSENINGQKAFTLLKILGWQMNFKKLLGIAKMLTESRSSRRHPHQLLKSAIPFRNNTNKEIHGK